MAVRRAAQNDSVFASKDKHFGCKSMVSIKKIVFSWKSLMFYSKIIVSGKNVKIFIIKWMFWHVTYWKYTYLYCMFGMFGLENQKTYIFTLYFLFFWFWGLPTQKLRFENYWIWQSCLRCVKTKKNKKYNLNMIVFWFYKPKKLKIQCKYMYFQCITCKKHWYCNEKYMILAKC